LSGGGGGGGDYFDDDDDSDVGVPKFEFDDYQRDWTPEDRAYVSAAICGRHMTAAQVAEACDAIDPRPPKISVAEPSKVPTSRKAKQKQKKKDASAVRLCCSSRLGIQGMAARIHHVGVDVFKVQKEFTYIKDSPYPVDLNTLRHTPEIQNMSYTTTKTTEKMTENEKKKAKRLVQKAAIEAGDLEASEKQETKRQKSRETEQRRKSTERLAIEKGDPDALLKQVEKSQKKSELAKKKRSTTQASIAIAAIAGETPMHY
jgi:hypothetical protein